MWEREEGEQREEVDDSGIREASDVDDSLDSVEAGRAGTSTLPRFLYCVSCFSCNTWPSDSCSCAFSPCSKIDDVMPCPSPCDREGAEVCVEVWGSW